MSKKISYSKRQISDVRSNAAQRECWAKYFERVGSPHEAAIQRKKAAQYKKAIQTMQKRSCHGRKIEE